MTSPIAGPWFGARRAIRRSIASTALPRPSRRHRGRAGFMEPRTIRLVRAWTRAAAPDRLQHGQARGDDHLPHHPDSGRMPHRMRPTSDIHRTPRAPPGRADGRLRCPDPQGATSNRSRPSPRQRVVAVASPRPIANRWTRDHRPPAYRGGQRARPGAGAAETAIVARPTGFRRADDIYIRIPIERAAEWQRTSSESA